MQHDFMKKNPIRELRLHFEYRDAMNNWFYSERFLNVEMVNSDEFFRIHPEPGEYVPAQPVTKFSVESIEPLDRTGLRYSRLVTYAYNKVIRYLKVEITSTLASIWQFDPNKLEAVFRELAEKKIAQMTSSGRFEDRFVVNTSLQPTQETTGFKAYQELRDSISK